MIQRVQSLFLLFATITIFSIIIYAPALQKADEFIMIEELKAVRMILLCSASLSVFAIFQFKNRKRQQLITYMARLMITISFLLVAFLYREDEDFGIGMLLLIVPFIFLFGASLFIKKDEKLVKSADRIR